MIDALLKNIDVNNAVISADALFANMVFVQKFLDHGADYLIGLKGTLFCALNLKDAFFATQKKEEIREVP